VVFVVGFAQQIQQPPVPAGKADQRQPDETLAWMIGIIHSDPAVMLRICATASEMLTVRINSRKATSRQT
jgi:hypothetical protein